MSEKERGAQNRSAVAVVKIFIARRTLARAAIRPNLSLCRRALRFVAINGAIAI